jgi:hypothetical protein
MSKYLGRLNDSSINEEMIVFTLIEAVRYNYTPTKSLFYKIYSSYPCTLGPSCESTVYISYNQIMKLLKEKHNVDLKNAVARYQRNTKRKHTYAESLLFDLGNGVMINLSSGYLEDGLESIFKVDFSVDKMYNVFRGFQIQFLPDKKEEVEELVELVEKSMMKKISEASLQMICKSNGSFYLTPITIKKPLITDIKLHYGEEFEEIHNTILKSLKCEESHGLILLHGLPGSGKTHYIRYLIQEFTDKQLIYVPPDMTSSISTPEFFPFMLQNKDSILIIEDAENIIKSREDKTSTTQSVANLLNLSDGLLGDSLHQPIIATFNCEINSIDSALLRKGRLICQHEFSKLSVENAQKLSNQLGFSTKIIEPMTLADIYGQDKKD